MSCRKGTFATVTGIGALLFGGLGIQTASAQTHSSSSHIFALSGDYEGAHDPSVIKAGDTWYVFTTGLAPLGHMAIRCSKDLQVWKLCGQVLREIPKRNGFAWRAQAQENFGHPISLTSTVRIPVDVGR